MAWRALLLSNVRNSIGFITDPFWLSVLAKAYRIQVRALVAKARVPIPPSDGCRVLGIPDPIGALREGEVFLLCEYEVYDQSHPSGVRVVRQPVVGDVMIYRNPCLHPGDVQRLRAVDKPGLQRYLNVLVLPTVGRRSVAACCRSPSRPTPRWYMQGKAICLPPHIYPHVHSLTRGFPTGVVVAVTWTAISFQWCGHQIFFPPPT